MSVWVQALRVSAGVMAAVTAAMIVFSPIVIGIYADVRNWDSTYTGEMDWCHDNAKMYDHVGNVGLAAGVVSFVVGFVCLGIIVAPLLGIWVQLLRPNTLTSLILPMILFALSFVLFFLYASVVAITSNMIQQKKDWFRPVTWPDPTYNCYDIPAKWNDCLAWAVIQTALCGFILIYSLLWVPLSFCALSTSSEDGDIPMKDIKSAEESSSDSDDDDDDLHVSPELAAILQAELDDSEFPDIDKTLAKNKTKKLKHFLKLQENDLKKMGFAEAIIQRLLALIKAERTKDDERKRRRDRGYLMVELDNALTNIFDEEDPEEKKQLEDVRKEFRRLKITDMDFFINMTDKEFKQLEVAPPVKEKLRAKAAELRESEEI